MMCKYQPILFAAAVFFIAAFMMVATPGLSQQAGEEAEEALPPGVVQLLPRGAIAAIFDPQFVSADEADLPDSAWVFGVVIQGEAHAYSLNLLNSHEIVNDVFGKLPVAATW
jgi:hypothetical protein